LIIELNDLPAGLRTLRITVVVERWELLQGSHWDRLPELFDVLSLMRWPVVAKMIRHSSWD
jgi:hypothetical protein